MRKLARTGPNRIDIRLSGRLDADGMSETLDALVRESEGIENGRLLYDVVDFHLPSLGAIALELARLPSMLGLMKRFERAAVLTDRAWIRQVSALEGRLLPGLTIKAFGRDQRDAAEAWLTADGGGGRACERMTIAEAPERCTMHEPNPINVRVIDHVVIRVTDLDGMIAFYTEVLGCRLERGPGELGLAQLRAGQSLIDLLAADSALGRRGGAAPDHGAPKGATCRARPHQAAIRWCESAFATAGP